MSIELKLIGSGMFRGFLFILAAIPSPQTWSRCQLVPAGTMYIRPIGCLDVLKTRSGEVQMFFAVRFSHPRRNTQTCTKANTTAIIRSFGLRNDVDRFEPVLD